MELRVWQTLAEARHEELVRAAMGVCAGDVGGIGRLRKMCSDAEVVRAALMLGEARRKGVAKFGAARAAGLWADPAGVEMATSLVVADYKLTMLSVMLPGWPMADLCCGIGGDSMAFAVGMDVLAVDTDPVRAWMAGMNAGCRTLVGDATSVDLPDGPVHIDPARRGGTAARRILRLDEMQPGWDAVRRIVRQNRWGAMVKLGPGVDIDRVQRELPEAQVEVISERGSLVQAVVRTGQLRHAGGSRQATMLMRRADEAWSGDREHTIEGEANGAALVPRDGFAAPRYVYEPDDSVERAELLGVLCQTVGAAMLHPRVGLLTSDEVIRSPWLTGFEVLEEMVWNERRVKGALEQRGAGMVEVKTRGKAVDTDAMQLALRGKGDERLVVFVLRMGSAMRGIIARRI